MMDLRRSGAAGSLLDNPRWVNSLFSTPDATGTMATCRGLAWHDLARLARLARRAGPTCAPTRAAASASSVSNGMGNRPRRSCSISKLRAYTSTSKPDRCTPISSTAGPHAR